MSFKIYTYPNNYRVWKAQIAAQYNGVEIELPAFEFGKTNTTAEFKAKFPLGKVPAMETPQGPIFESNAIARYIAGLRTDTGLLGNTTYERSQVDQWIDWNTNELEPARGIWIYPILGYLQYNAKAYEQAKKETTNALNTLNQHLLRNTFIAANQITLADIVIASTLVAPFSMLLDTKAQAAIPNVLRWFNTVLAQPQVAKVIGKVTFATEEKKAAGAGKGGDKPAAAKADKPKEAPKPKEEKKEKPAAAADYDDEAPAPKKKNPLDDLPPSAMVLDTMKKLAFSERPIKKSFFEEFWPQFDAAGYSAWTCDYKYNNENQVFYMTGNAVGGFIQRSDACRKYALGVMNITGNEDEETGPFLVHGAWIWRGTDFLADMKNENPDSEYYEWTKVDTTTEEGRNKIKEQFMAESIKGKKVLDRRFFK